jgi:hypothetical protein
LIEFVAKCGAIYMENERSGQGRRRRNKIRKEEGDVKIRRKGKIARRI